MTYDRRRRDDDRRRHDEKRKADEQRKKAAEQKKIDDKRRRQAASQKEPAKKHQTNKPATNKPHHTVESLQQFRAKYDELGAQYDPQWFDDQIARLQQQQPQQQPQPQIEQTKQKGFLDKVGGAIDEAKKRGGRALNSVKNFGAGFGGQFLDNQAHTPIQDAINPQAGQARQNWLERESQNSSAFAVGRKAADVVNIVQGAGQMGVGGTATVGGTVVSGTGAGAAVAVPTAEQARLSGLSVI
jgi:hypothetical protein